jgi:hypothetical protein
MRVSLQWVTRRHSWLSEGTNTGFMRRIPVDNTLIGQHIFATQHYYDFAIHFAKIVARSCKILNSPVSKAILQVSEADCLEIFRSFRLPHEHNS